MEERLLDVAREILGIDGIDLDTPRAETEEWDSAAHLVLLSELEEELGIKVPIEGVGDIGRLRDFLEPTKG